MRQSKRHGRFAGRRSGPGGGEGREGRRRGPGGREERAADRHSCPAMQCLVMVWRQRTVWTEVRRVPVRTCHTTDAVRVLGGGGCSKPLPMLIPCITCAKLSFISSSVPLLAQVEEAGLSHQRHHEPEAGVSTLRGVDTSLRGKGF